MSKKASEREPEKKRKKPDSDKKEGAQPNAAPKGLQRERVPDLQAGKYSDGHPLDEIQYLECKLILTPDRFAAAKTFLEYGAMVSRTAKEYDLTTKGPRGL